MQAEKLLAWSNEQLEDKDWGETTDLKKAMVAIGIKMMMLYGIGQLLKAGLSDSVIKRITGQVIS